MRDDKISGSEEVHDIQRNQQTEFYSNTPLFIYKPKSNMYDYQSENSSPKPKTENLRVDNQLLNHTHLVNFSDPALPPLDSCTGGSQTERKEHLRK